MIYSSPKYLGPEWRSLRIKDLELKTLDGFNNFFLAFLTGMIVCSDVIKPGNKFLGSNDWSYYLSIFFFAFFNLSVISSSSSPQRQVKQHQRQEDFRYVSWFINLFVGIRFNL